MLGLRVAYGAALLAAPGRVTRSWLGPAGGEPPAAVAVRGLGAREVAMHAAAAVAAWRGQPVRPWLVHQHRRRPLRHRGHRRRPAKLPPKAAPATAIVAGASAAISAAVAAAVDC